MLKVHTVHVHVLGCYFFHRITMPYVILRKKLKKGMLTLELSSYALEIPYDAYTTATLTYLIESVAIPYNLIW